MNAYSVWQEFLQWSFRSHNLRRVEVCMWLHSDCLQTLQQLIEAAVIIPGAQACWVLYQSMFHFAVLISACSFAFLVFPRFHQNWRHEKWLFICFSKLCPFVPCEWSQERAYSAPFGKESGCRCPYRPSLLHLPNTASFPAAWKAKD